MADLAGYTARIANMTEVAVELKNKYNEETSTTQPTSSEVKELLISKEKSALELEEAEKDSTTCFGGQFLYGEAIKFDAVTCLTPLGKTLVRSIILSNLRLL